MTSAVEPLFTAIVVAAGRSTRLGGPIPKPFLTLGASTILAHSIRGMLAAPSVGDVVVVMPPSEIGGARAVEVEALPGVRAVVAGGESRSDSVRQGLVAAGEAIWVLVHDAARPFASAKLVERVALATKEHGAAIPALPVADTVQRVAADGFIEQPVDRAALRMAQTPQGARRETLIAALERAKAEGESVTDEASALRGAGLAVATVLGDSENFKITTDQDLRRARRQLEEHEMDLRVGTGFDIHRIKTGRRLVLGGVYFPDEPGLDGHSDADVVLHAAMDALLGAAGMADIGEHFPPGDPEFADADSRELAATVAKMIGDAGYEVLNLDLMLLAERPRIRPRAAEMREAIAAALGLETGQVGLKATTLEKLGALGRGEGIAAEAVALLRRRV